MAKKSSLAEYQKKRNFSKTPEPEGKVQPQGEQPLYIIQKHDATRLHYDLRLELNGTLKSWAVPKGPSLDSTEKRLAVHVEDHPIDYGSFEGIIPKGEYGGGTVMVWDRGWWEPLGEAENSYAKGSLKFRLHGEKLKGKWALVQMRGNSSEEGKNWLLIKEKDEEARSASEYEITEERPESMKTGRIMEKIAADEDRVWTDAREIVGAEVKEKMQKKKKKTKSTSKKVKIDPSGLAGAKRSEQPDFLPPQLATPAEKAPEGDEWLHEVKFDGYRIIAIIKDKSVRLMSRNGLDWTNRLKKIAEVVGSLPLDQGIIDGEVVVLNQNGISDFQSLQNHMRSGEKKTLYYYVFDLPHCQGHDLTKTTLVERKQLLQDLIDPTSDPFLRYSEHILGNGEIVYRNACQLRLEGIVSKRAGSAYETKRSRNWVKVKCGHRQEFIIVGFTDPAGSRKHFGALMLAVKNDNNELIYCGRVGTGFTDKTLKSIHDNLKPLEQKEPPVRNPPRGAGARGIHWVQPEYVCEVSFTEWTTDNQLRHPSFQGLREDKYADQVEREKPLPTAPSIKKSVRKKGSEVEVAGVRLSNPHKILYPDQGVTKLQLAQYYESIAEWVLPYITNRPISIVRCPQGVGEKCFYQRHVTESLPQTVSAVPITTDEGLKDYITISDLQGLISLVQLGVLEIHPWGCRKDDIEHPDWIVFDLDPAPDVAWKKVLDAALMLKQKLKDLNLKSFAKTTGGKGIHVVVPIKPRQDWDTVKEFSKVVAEEIVRENPQEFIATMSKAKRTGKIFVDYLRNGRTATSVAAYSTRARSGTPISVPLFWEELENGITPETFTLESVPQRMHDLARDPWDEFFKSPQDLPNRN